MKRRHLHEDVNMNDVRSIVNSKLDDFLNKREFEKKVNDISVKVLEKFVSQLFTKKSRWLSSLK